MKRKPLIVGYEGELVRNLLVRIDSLDRVISELRAEIEILKDMSKPLIEFNKL